MATPPKVSACGKVCYDTAKQAFEVMAEVAHRYGDFTMSCYQCRTCRGKWHYGHERQEDKKLASLKQRLRELKEELPTLRNEARRAHCLRQIEIVQKMLAKTEKTIAATFAV